MNMKPQKTKLATEPYKGTRDFYPEDASVQKYIFSTWRSVVEKFGYVEYDASLIEETELYRAKSGQELVNEQTYSFTDRGGREVTIRPEMTPTVARMVARRRKQLSFPLRWYSIPNLFRYERPQKGRLREHWQLNVDYFGPVSFAVEAEVLHVAYDIMHAFGATDAQFEIRVNNRRLMNTLFTEVLGLNAEKALATSKLIDRMKKIKPAEFESAANELLGGKISVLLAFLRAKDLSELSDALKKSEGAHELMHTVNTLRAMGINNVVFDPTIMRGFDYYTGTVFEIFDTGSENKRSLFGGGRYDNLVGIFGVEAVPGVGFGMGDVTIRDFLETYKLLPEFVPTTELVICAMHEGLFPQAEMLAAELRKNSLKVALDFTTRKIGKQIAAAEKQGVPFVLCVGDNEAKSGRYELKHMKTRKTFSVGPEEILVTIRGLNGVHQTSTSGR